MNIIPTIIENTEKNQTMYDIYSMLLKKRIIFLTGEINDQIASIIVSELLYLDSLNNDDIYLYINSPGGSVSAGLSIYDTMNFINSNIITIGIGLCASMGALLLSSGNIRYAFENCDIMIHEVLGGAQGQATDIEILSNHINIIKNKVNNILAKNTKKTIKQIEKCTIKDNYMTVDDAIKFGIVDKILNKKTNQF